MELVLCHVSCGGEGGLSVTVMKTITFLLYSLVTDNTFMRTLEWLFIFVRIIAVIIAK